MKIKLIRTGKEFKFDGKGSLLSFLEKQGLKLDYGCRSGHCGFCRLHLKSGEVSYPREPLAFVREDEILPCCCKVESDLEIVL